MSNFSYRTMPLFFILLTLITACDKKNKNTSSSTPSVSDPKKGFYKHLKGTVGDYPITMDLVKNVVNSDRETVESWAGFNGYYYYDKYQEPIMLYGSLDSTGMIVLEEWSAEGKSAQFRGNLTPEGAFIGTWQDSGKTKTLNVALKEVYADGALTLESVEYSDSFRLFDKLKNSPVATFGMDVLMPAKNTEGTVAAFLKNEIFSNMRYENGGEEVPETPLPKKDYTNVQLADLQKAQRDSFFAYYRSSMTDVIADSAAEYFSENYARTSEIQVLFNENNLLSLGYSGYAFDGGAHGNYGTSLASYDLTTKKHLSLDDVFKPNYQKTVSAALEKALRKKYNLNPKEGLNQFLFDNTIEANNNFALTPKGILFNYTPYEIAAYAMGEIQLYLSFDDLKAVLK
jgi:Protein of unknown function (DUF3298)/Deacetylase PdaC